MITMNFTGIFFIPLFLACTAFTRERRGPLVSTAWLAELQDEVLILDVRIEPRSFGKPLSKTDNVLFAATRFKDSHLISRITKLFKI